MAEEGNATAFATPYLWLSGLNEQGEPRFRSIDEFIGARNPTGSYSWPELKERLNEELNGVRSGDIIIVMDGQAGYLTIHAADGEAGWHGGPSKAESDVPLMFNFLGFDKSFVQDAVNAVENDPSRIGGALRDYHLTPIVVKILEAVTE